MPELPEVETTRLGLCPVIGQCVASVTVRHYGLRWPIPQNIDAVLRGKTLQTLDRRAKYILATLSDTKQTGTLLLHLGMSGRLCLLPQAVAPEKHDHLDIQFADGRLLRLRDPRRFGAVLWCEGDINSHPLLASLGPEPLEASFHADDLFRKTRSKTLAIKQVLMDAHVVVGVGNIYASEALFRAGIHPCCPAKHLSYAQCERLVLAIKTTLQAALEAGGSSLRDFFGVDGNPGYFQQTYFVYGRTNLPCRVCESPIQSLRQGQRSSFYCPECQPEFVSRA